MNVALGPTPDLQGTLQVCWPDIQEHFPFDLSLHNQVPHSHSLKPQKAVWSFKRLHPFACPVSALESHLSSVFFLWVRFPCFIWYKVLVSSSRLSLPHSLCSTVLCVSLWCCFYHVTTPQVDSEGVCGLIPLITQLRSWCKGHEVGPPMGLWIS